MPEAKNLYSQNNQFLDFKTRFLKSLFFLGVILCFIISFILIFLPGFKSLNFEYFLNKYFTDLSKERVQIGGNVALPGNGEDFSNVLTKPLDPETLSFYNKDELSMLGVIPLPENYYVQETYKGISFVASPTSSYSEYQLFLLKYFIDLTPPILLQDGPTAIITYSPGELDEDVELNQEEEAAKASGTYVFYNQNSFEPKEIDGQRVDNSVDAKYKLFVHELAHVYQFNESAGELSPREIEENAKNGRNWLDLVLVDDLTIGFASNTGWQKVESDSGIEYVLSEPEKEKATDYGKRAIHEDMAESISYTILTNTNNLSESRVNWVYEIFGFADDQLTYGKLPVMQGTESISPEFPKSLASTFDLSKEEEFTGNRRYQFVNSQAFILKEKNSIDSVSAYMLMELGNRGWEGFLEKETDINFVTTHKGSFNSHRRDIYLEMKTFDNALNYSTKPEGTIIYVVSGYK